MAIAFKSTWVNFDPTVGRLQKEPGHVVFDRSVCTANAALKGFKVNFTNGDHHIVAQEVDIANVRIEKNTVNFVAELLLRDSSGHIDDPFEGTIEVLVIADLEE